MNKSFDEKMNDALLANGFEYFDDWKHGPICNLPCGYDLVSMKLFRHDFGYWIIFRRHASGKNIETNLGTSNSASDIIVLRDALAKVGK